jgi:hypothetical protein
MRCKILYKFGIGVGFCLLLAGCDAPLLFWEEEALKVADDALIEEANLKHPPSQNTSSKTSHSK